MQKSIGEGFGLTVTEAMWKGKTVVGGTEDHSICKAPGNCCACRSHCVPWQLQSLHCCQQRFPVARVHGARRNFPWAGRRGTFPPAMAPSELPWEATLPHPSESGGFPRKLPRLFRKREEDMLDELCGNALGGASPLGKTARAVPRRIAVNQDVLRRFGGGKIGDDVSILWP